MLLLTVKLAEKHVKINQPGNTTSPSVSEEFFKFGNNTTFQKVSTWADKWQTKQKKKCCDQNFGLNLLFFGYIYKPSMP